MQLDNFSWNQKLPIRMKLRSVFHVVLWGLCVEICNSNEGRSCKLRISFYSIVSTVAGIVTRLWESWFKIQIPAGAKDFSLQQNVPTSSGAHPASYLVGASVSFPGDKVAGHEPYHSLPSSAKVNEWSLPPWPQMPSCYTEGELYLFEYSNDPLVFIKGSLLSWLAERVLAFEVGICSMGLGWRYTSLVHRNIVAVLILILYHLPLTQIASILIIINSLFIKCLWHLIKELN
jgi:hypothetical protein